MPLDPSIPLSVQPIRFNDLGDSFMRAFQMREQIESSRALREQREAIAEDRRAQTDKRRREEANAQAAATAIQHGGGTRDRTLAWATTNAPQIVPDLTEYFDKSDKSAAEIRKLQQDLNDRRLNHIGAAAEQILKRFDMPGALESGLALYGEQFPDDQASVQQLGQQLQGLPPEQQRMYLERVRDMAPDYRARAAKNTPQVVAPGGSLVDDQGKVLYSAPAKPPSKQFQSKEMLVNGKLTQVSFDPDTNQWFLPGTDQPLSPGSVAPAPPQRDPTLAALSALTLKNAQQNVGQLPYKTQQRVDMKSRSFDQQPVVKRVQTMAEAVDFAKGMDPKTNNPADDQALIYAFAKAMDPDSVVREGEYATVQKYAQSWASSLGFNAARIFSNTPFLTEQARGNMKRTIEAKFNATKTQYENLRSSYGKQIDAITGLKDGAERLVDYGGAFPGQAAPNGTPTAAPGMPSYQDYLNSRKKPGGQ